MVMEKQTIELRTPDYATGVYIFLDTRNIFNTTFLLRNILLSTIITVPGKT